MAEERRTVATHTVISIFSPTHIKLSEDSKNGAIILACKQGNIEHALTLSENEKVEHDSSANAICCERGWTPLHYACSFNGEKYMEGLMNVGYDPRSKDLRGVTPLHLACQYGPLQIVRLLINDLATRNYSIESECTDCQGNTPIHSACQYGQLDILDELLNYVDIKVMVQQNYQGETPFQIALQQSEIDIVIKYAALVLSAENLAKHIAEDVSTVFCYSACVKGRKDAVDFLLQNGFKLSQVAIMYGTSAVSIASRYGHKEVVVALIEYGDSSTNPDGSTPLHNACEYGHLDVALTLVGRHGFDPLKQNSKGVSPLLLAYYNHHKAVLRYIHQWLVSKGDTLQNYVAVEWPIEEIVDKKSRSTSLILEAIERPSTLLTLEQRFDRACQRGNLVAIKILCESENVNPLLPIQNDGAAALHIVCENGYSDIAFYLIDSHQCDPMATTMNGSTAFHCANNPTQNIHPINHLRVLEVLFGLYFREHFGNTGTYQTSSGVTIHEERQVNIKHLRNYTSLDLNRKNAEGKTQFHYACLNGLRENVRLLLRKGCEPELIDKDGNTAMHLACLSGNAETVSVLSEYSSRLCNPKSKNNNHDTPLHFAASTGKMELTTTSLNLYLKLIPLFRQIPRNRVNDTPLHEACRSGSVSFVRFLVEDMRYSIKATNSYGETALFSACCKAGNIHVVEYLTTRMGSLKVSSRAGDSPLHKACEFGQYEIVKLLISKSQQNYLKMLCNNEGLTPLHTACSFGQSAIVEYLLECSLWNPNQPNHLGRTPLHCIIRGFELELCSLTAAQKTLKHLLMVKNLNLSPIDESGQTPFSMCENSKLALSLLSHMDSCAELYMKYGSQTQPQTLPDSFLNIFVLGNRAVGKSSLILALQDEKWHFISQKVTGVLPCTVGIIPTAFASKQYGLVNFLELAGHYE